MLADSDLYLPSGLVLTRCASTGYPWEGLDPVDRQLELVRLDSVFCV